MKGTQFDIRLIEIYSLRRYQIPSNHIVEISFSKRRRGLQTISYEYLPIPFLSSATFLQSVA